MEQQKVVESSRYLLDAEEEAEEEEEELVGPGFKRSRHPRPAKNLFDAPHVSYGLATATSNISTITSEEEDPEPEPEPGLSGRWVGNVGSGNGHPAADTGVVEDGNGTGEAGDEVMQKGGSFEEEHDTESSDDQQEEEHGDVGYIASKTETTYAVYDLRAKKPDDEEDLIKNFHKIRDHGVGDVGDLTVEIYETREVISPLKDEYEKLSDARLSSPEKSYQEEAAISLIGEVEPEETEFNVEGVLKKQNTHDLYCPKCRSCITRKVILVRKRRRLIGPWIPRKPRGDRVIVPSEPNASIPEAEAPSPDALPVSDPQTDAAVDHEDNRQPEVFRCLSCFAFFIPTEDGFKLFRFFEKRGDPGSVPEGEEVPAVATESAFVSFFRWKKKPAVPEGPDSDMANDSLPNEDSSVPSAKTTGLPKPLPSDNDVTPEPKKVEEGSVDSSPQDTASSRKEINLQFNTYYKGSPAKDVDSSPQDTASSREVPPYIQILQINTYRGEPVEETENDLPVKKNHSTESKDVVADSLIFPSPPEKSENGAVKVPEESTKKNNGGAVIIPTERAPASETPADVENQAQAENQPLLDETRPAAAPVARDFDILKSVVYGGLVESIASLGVVSSAAGGGAATLNTLALTMANLITGLFVLVHNLRDLKNEQYDLAQTQTDLDQDRYFQNLGRRGKFSLHATVAVLSYLVFGLVAPITYGFSFRESDDRDYKLAAVAAACLPCILVLALVKAHVRSKSYVKTGLYYLMMGIAASGISFLVGVLIDKLLEQLGLFNTGSTSTSFSGVLRGVSVSGSGRASY